MKTLYFDCFAGASGDMILGALIGLGLHPMVLATELQAMNVKGWRLACEQVDRSGISAYKVDVVSEEQTKHRHLSDIVKILADSDLSDGVKARATQIFTRLGEAEAKIHNIPVERIHFHEVGAIDAIVDVVGACVGFEAFGIERFCSSALNVGSGMVDMSHGRFPVPPPAVTALLIGAPVYTTEIQGELVTPTGAAIISTVVNSYGTMPHMRIDGVGYGAGSRTYEKFPNVLRLVGGELLDAEFVNDERLLLVECNIDDMSAQVSGFVMERALEIGALDCYLTPVQMKKDRPGVLISILCRPQQRDAIEALLFAESTTLGIRSTEVSRRSLAREMVTVETRFGSIGVKVATLANGERKIMPEFEDCRAVAIARQTALRDVVDAARHAYFNGLIAAVESAPDAADTDKQ